MDYQKIYNNIIRRGQTRILEGYTEKHHIVPRCIGGTNDADNLVSLTPEEHYLCHLLLVKIHPNNIRLVKAAMFMVSANKDQQRNNKAYGWLKRQYSEYMRGPNNPGKNQPKESAHWKFGKPFDPSCFTESGLKSMSEAKRGEKNPNSGVKPWNHPRATEVTRSLWKKSDEIYNIWIANNRPSYCKLYGLTMNKNYNWKDNGNEAGPFMNMVKYFRNGWVPKQDVEWMKYKDKDMLPICPKCNTRHHATAPCPENYGDGEQ